MKLHGNLRLVKSTDIKDYFLTIVYRRDGIVNVEYIELMCEAPNVAEKWKNAVNMLLLCCNPHRNASMATFLSKRYFLGVVFTLPYDIAVMICVTECIIQPI